MPGSDHLNDRELVERARLDPEAFAVLYRRYLPRIRAFIIRRCGNRQVADDLTAAVFERAWRHLHRIEVPDNGIGPWLYRVASNEVSSAFRKGGRGQRAQERLERTVVLDAPDAADEVLLRSDIEAVRAALATLPERHQEVISLRYLAGLSPQETSEIMGVGPPAVAAVLHRALKGLDRALRAAGFDPLASGEPVAGEAPPSAPERNEPFPNQMNHSSDPNRR